MKHTYRWPGLAVFLLAIPWLLAPLPRAWAAELEATTVDSLRFRLQPFAGDILAAPGTKGMEPLQITGSLLMQGEHRPIYLVEDGVRTMPVIRDRLITEVGAAMGVGRGFAVWADFPLVAYQAGWWPQPDDDLQAVGPGDLRIGGLFPLLKIGKSPFGLAIRPAIQIPTGMQSAFSSSGVMEFHPDVAMEVRPGPVRVTALVGGRLRPSADWSGVQSHSAFRYGLGAEVRLHRNWTAATSWSGEVSGSVAERPMELLVAGAFNHDRFRATVFLGRGLAPGVGSPDFRAGFQVGLTLDRWIRKPQVTLKTTGEPAEPGVLPHGYSNPVTVEQASTHPVPRGSTELLIASPVQFAEGETELSDEARQALETVAAYLSIHPELTPVVVLGHGDEGGGAKYNVQLCRRRAVATRSYLIEEGGLHPTRLALPPEGEPDDLLATRNRRIDRSTVAFIVANQP